MVLAKTRAQDRQRGGGCFGYKPEAPPCRRGYSLNAQWMHGFFTEAGEDNLQDYIMVFLEKKFFREELKLKLGGGLNVQDFDDFSENYAYIIIPEISYYPADNVELTLGTFILEGKETTMFGQMKDQDQIFLKARVSF